MILETQPWKLETTDMTLSDGERRTLILFDVRRSIIKAPFLNENAIKFVVSVSSDKINSFPFLKLHFHVV